MTTLTQPTETVPFAAYVGEVMPASPKKDAHYDEERQLQVCERSGEPLFKLTESDDGAAIIWTPQNGFGTRTNIPVDGKWEYDIIRDQNY